MLIIRDHVPASDPSATSREPCELIQNPASSASRVFVVMLVVAAFVDARDRDIVELRNWFVGVALLEP